MYGLFLARPLPFCNLLTRIDQLNTATFSRLRFPIALQRFMGTLTLNISSHEPYCQVCQYNGRSIILESCYSNHFPLMISRVLISFMHKLFLYCFALIKDDFKVCATKLELIFYCCQISPGNQKFSIILRLNQIFLTEINTFLTQVHINPTLKIKSLEISFSQ